MTTAGSSDRRYGMGRGKVFPASRARSLLNPLRRLVQSARRTVSAMGLSRDARVLEVGAGPGFFSPELARAVPGGRLVVLDLQPEMLDLARHRLEGAPADLVAADAARLPFRRGSFDAALVATVLGEVPDRGACVAEARRVLRGGGQASFAETRRDSDFVPLANLVTEVEGNAFALDAVSGPRWQYVARFRAV